MNIAYCSEKLECDACVKLAREGHAASNDGRFA